MLRFGARPWFLRFVDIVMMAAAVAFTLQSSFIAQAATGTNSHYPRSHTHSSHRHAKEHVVTHVHADGTVHQHALDGGARTLNGHLREPGCPCCWNMAIVIAVLPILPVPQVKSVASSRLTIETPDPFRGTEPDGPRRPPRPPSIA